MDDYEKKELLLQAVIMLVAVALVAVAYAVYQASQPLTFVIYTTDSAAAVTVSEAPVEREAGGTEKEWFVSWETPVQVELPSREEGPSEAEQPVLVEKSVDLNTAGLEELQQLPGIGPVLAQRIVDHRAAYGPFLEIEELMEVSGIGEKTFERLREFLTIS